MKGNVYEYAVRHGIRCIAQNPGNDCSCRSLFREKLANIMLAIRCPAKKSLPKYDLSTILHAFTMSQNQRSTKAGWICENVDLILAAGYGAEQNILKLLCRQGIVGYISENGKKFALLFAARDSCKFLVIQIVYCLLLSGTRKRT